MLSTNLSFYVASVINIFVEHDSPSWQSLLKSDRYKINAAYS